ncbi:uncharacterized protein LOC143233548 [Tachypleus tridentatus]|uniref:uncharacterized protein LOC143233548 n=1 Tax=Tachypleus tridentatus TaxID=6853 RepID=UPI003FD13E01
MEHCRFPIYRPFSSLFRSKGTQTETSRQSQRSVGVQTEPLSMILPRVNPLSKNTVSESSLHENILQNTKSVGAIVPLISEHCQLMNNNDNSRGRSLTESDKKQIQKAPLLTSGTTADWMCPTLAKDISKKDILSPDSNFDTLTFIVSPKDLEGIDDQFPAQTTELEKSLIDKHFRNLAHRLKLTLQTESIDIDFGNQCSTNEPRDLNATNTTWRSNRSLQSNEDSSFGFGNSTSQLSPANNNIFTSTLTLYPKEIHSNKSEDEVRENTEVPLLSVTEEKQNTSDKEERMPEGKGKFSVKENLSDVIFFGHESITSANSLSKKVTDDWRPNLDEQSISSRDCENLGTISIQFGNELSKCEAKNVTMNSSTALTNCTVVLSSTFTGNNQEKNHINEKHLRIPCVGRNSSLEGSIIDWIQLDQEPHEKHNLENLSTDVIDNKIGRNEDHCIVENRREEDLKRDQHDKVLSGENVCSEKTDTNIEVAMVTQQRTCNHCPESGKEVTVYDKFFDYRVHNNIEEQIPHTRDEFLNIKYASRKQTIVKSSIAENETAKEIVLKKCSLEPRESYQSKVSILPRVCEHSLSSLLFGRKEKTVEHENFCELLNGTSNDNGNELCEFGNVISSNFNALYKANRDILKNQRSEMIHYRRNRQFNAHKITTQRGTCDTSHLKGTCGTSKLKQKLVEELKEILHQKSTKMFPPKYIGPLTIRLKELRKEGPKNDQQVPDSTLLETRNKLTSARYAQEPCETAAMKFKIKAEKRLPGTTVLGKRTRLAPEIYEQQFHHIKPLEVRDNLVHTECEPKFPGTNALEYRANLSHTEDVLQFVDTNTLEYNFSHTEHVPQFLDTITLKTKDITIPSEYGHQFPDGTTSEARDTIAVDTKDQLKHQPQTVNNPATQKKNHLEHEQRLVSLTKREIKNKVKVLPHDQQLLEEFNVRSRYGFLITRRDEPNVVHDQHTAGTSPLDITDEPRVVHDQHTVGTSPLDITDEPGVVYDQHTVSTIPTETTEQPSVVHDQHTVSTVPTETTEQLSVVHGQHTVSTVPTETTEQFSVVHDQHRVSTVPTETTEQLSVVHDQHTVSTVPTETTEQFSVVHDQHTVSTVPTETTEQLSVVHDQHTVSTVPTETTEQFSVVRDQHRVSTVPTETTEQFSVVRDQHRVSTVPTETTEQLSVVRDQHRVSTVPTETTEQLSVVHDQHTVSTIPTETTEQVGLVQYQPTANTTPMETKDGQSFKHYDLRTKCGMTLEIKKVVPKANQLGSLECLLSIKNEPNQICQAVDPDKNLQAYPELMIPVQDAVDNDDLQYTLQDQEHREDKRFSSQVTNQKQTAPDVNFALETVRSFNFKNCPKPMHVIENPEQNPPTQLKNWSLPQTDLLPKLTLLEKFPEEHSIRDEILTARNDLVKEDKEYKDSYHDFSTQDVTSRTVSIKKPPKYEFTGRMEKEFPLELPTTVKEKYRSDRYKHVFKSLHRLDQTNDEYSCHSTLLDNQNIKKMIEDFRTNIIPRNTTKSNQHLSPHSSTTSLQECRNHSQSIMKCDTGNSVQADIEVKLQGRQVLYPRDDPPRRMNYCMEGYESDTMLVSRISKDSRQKTGHEKNKYQDFQQKFQTTKYEGIRYQEVEQRFPDARHMGNNYQELPQEFQNNKHEGNRYQKLQQSFLHKDKHLVFSNNAQSSLEEQFYGLLRSSSEDDEFKQHRGKKEHENSIKELDMGRQKNNFMSLPPKPTVQYDNLHECSVILPCETYEVCDIACVLFSFTAKTPRELSLNKGDIVYVNKKIDKNWCEIEYLGKTGIFPVKYLKIIPLDEPQKTTEGKATVKLSFSAQSSMELSLLKGETVILTGKVDQNWYKGRIGHKKGIVPSAYLDVLYEPKDLNAGSLPPESLGLTSNSRYTTALNGIISYERDHTNFCSKAEVASTRKKTHVKSSGNSPQEETIQPVEKNIQLNTNAKPVLYQAVYNYTPQYRDELELQEGDTIFVTKKYDDGWYVGISVQTGLFGTFPGNYVAQI